MATSLETSQQTYSDCSIVTLLNVSKKKKKSLQTICVYSNVFWVFSDVLQTSPKSKFLVVSLQKQLFILFCDVLKFSSNPAPFVRIGNDGQVNAPVQGSIRRQQSSSVCARSLQVVSMYSRKLRYMQSPSHLVQLILTGDRQCLIVMLGFLSDNRPGEMKGMQQCN